MHAVPFPPERPSGAETCAEEEGEKQRRKEEVTGEKAGACTDVFHLAPFSKQHRVMPSLQSTHLLEPQGVELEYSEPSKLKTKASQPCETTEMTPWLAVMVCHHTALLF